jgi:hypothetical protein
VAAALNRSNSRHDFGAGLDPRRSVDDQFEDGLRARDHVRQRSGEDPWLDGGEYAMWERGERQPT